MGCCSSHPCSRQGCTNERYKDGLCHHHHTEAKNARRAMPPGPMMAPMGAAPMMAAGQAQAACPRCMQVLAFPPGVPSVACRCGQVFAPPPMAAGVPMMQGPMYVQGGYRRDDGPGFGTGLVGGLVGGMVLGSMMDMGDGFGDGGFDGGFD
eukprot:tig00000459_g1081.t1